MFSITPYNNSQGGGAYYRLLDKNKKQLTHKSYVANDRYDEEDYESVKYYTVNKGTYFLEVNATCSLYEIKSIEGKIYKEAGSSKSKAKLLKNKGKEANGYFTISDKSSKVDWYKFSVPTNSQYIDLTIAYRLDGDIVFQILDSKGEILFDSSKKDGLCLEGAYYNWVGRMYSKGTYYVKVYKGSKNSSFSYGLVLKKLIND